jgi:hypothetical protein
MKPFGISVTAINPGMHKTPAADGKAIAGGLKKVWDSMTPEHQREYGEGTVIKYCCCNLIFLELIIHVQRRIHA